MLYMFIFTFIGSIFATILGGGLSLISKKAPKSIFNFLQNFSLGAIIGFLFIELFSHSFEELNIYFDNNLIGVSVSLAIIFATGLIFYFLHEFVHKLSHHHKEDHDDKEACEDHAHTVDLFNGTNSLLVTSFIYLGAIFVHNIPEGLTLGLSFIGNNGSFPIEGVIVSIVLFIHNLIIGFTMCNSFVKSGKSNSFSFAMTLISSLPAFILAIVSYFISTISIDELFNGILTSISAGSLLYVTFIELVPQTFHEYKTKYSFIFILLGIVIISLLLNI